MQKRRSFKKRKNHKQGSRNDGLLYDLFKELSPENALVAFGLLTQILSTRSILISKSKTVQFVVEGTLQRQTRQDLFLEALSDRPLNEAVKIILQKLGNRSLKDVLSSLLRI